MKLLNIFFFLILTIASNAQSTASKNIQKLKLKTAQMDTTKTIWIYTPAKYQVDSLSLPVIYMFDAQNLFDSETSFVGEWEIDEYLDDTASNFIVVGIEHGNSKRLEELTPYPNKTHGGGQADGMLDFIIETLKPHIDSSYRTKAEARYTSIAGSSLGGLTSFYAALKYPDIFGSAGVFSPSFWINPEIFDFVEKQELSKKTRFFFTAGTAEGETMVPNLEKMISLLVKKGMSLDKLQMNVVDGGKHNETFWSSQIPEFIDWLKKVKPNRFQTLEND